MIGALADLAKRCDEIVGLVAIVVDDEQTHGSHQVGSGHTWISRGCVTHNSLHRYSWQLSKPSPWPSCNRGRPARTRQDPGETPADPEPRTARRGETPRPPTHHPARRDACRALLSLFFPLRPRRNPPPTGRRR